MKLMMKSALLLTLLSPVGFAEDMSSLAGINELIDANTYMTPKELQGKSFIVESDDENIIDIELTPSKAFKKKVLERSPLKMKIQIKDAKLLYESGLFGPTGIEIKVKLIRRDTDISGQKGKATIISSDSCVFNFTYKTVEGKPISPKAVIDAQGKDSFDIEGPAEIIDVTDTSVIVKRTGSGSAKLNVYEIKGRSKNVIKQDVIRSCGEFSKGTNDSIVQDLKPEDCLSYSSIKLGDYGRGDLREKRALYSVKNICDRNVKCDFVVSGVKKSVVDEIERSSRRVRSIDTSEKAIGSRDEVIIYEQDLTYRKRAFTPHEYKVRFEEKKIMRKLDEAFVIGTDVKRNCVWSDK